MKRSDKAWTVGCIGYGLLTLTLFAVAAFAVYSVAHWLHWL
jgi:hypothetical protein